MRRKHRDEKNMMVDFWKISHDSGEITRKKYYIRKYGKKENR